LNGHYNSAALLRCVCDLGSIFEAFVPPEGDGVASLLSGKVTHVLCHQALCFIIVDFDSELKSVESSEFLCQLAKCKLLYYESLVNVSKWRELVDCGWSEMTAANSKVVKLQGLHWIETYK